MSQTATVIVEETTEKHGETNGRAWTKFGLKDGNGDWYSTFERGLVNSTLKGERVELEYEQDGKFKNLLRVSPVEAKPEPGTGNYIKGKEAPETQRAISASVALQQAVVWCSSGKERDALTEQAVILVAGKFYGWLLDRAEGKDLAGPTTSRSSDDEDIPF